MAEILYLGNNVPVEMPTVCVSFRAFIVFIRSLFFYCVFSLLISFFSFTRLDGKSGRTGSGIIQPGDFKGAIGLNA